MDRSGDTSNIGKSHLKIVQRHIIVRPDGGECLRQSGKTEGQIALFQTVETLADRADDLGVLQGGVAPRFLDSLLLHLYRIVDRLGCDTK